MIKKLILLNLCFLTMLCFGQKSEIENLFKIAVKEIVPTNFEYYNLLDSSLDLNFPRNITIDSVDDNEFIQSNPDFPLEEFVLNKRTNKVNWNDYHLEKSRVYSYENIPKFESQIRINHLVPYNTTKEKIETLERNRKFYEIILPVKRHWGKKRIKRELTKKIAKYQKDIKLEDKKYFMFSVPIFFNNYQYAIIKMHSSGYGFTSIFKKINGVWAPIYKFDRWIS